MSPVHSGDVKHLCFMAQRELQDHGLAGASRLKLRASSTMLTLKTSNWEVEGHVMHCLLTIVKEYRRNSFPRCNF